MNVEEYPLEGEQVLEDIALSQAASKVSTKSMVIINQLMNELDQEK